MFYLSKPAIFGHLNLCISIAIVYVNLVRSINMCLMFSCGRVLLFINQSPILTCLNMLRPVFCVKMDKMNMTTKFQT